MSDSRFEQGLKFFKEVHGEDSKELLENLGDDEYGRYMISGYADYWGQPEKLDWRAREIAAISCLVALGNPDEAMQHIRCSITENRINRREIMELMIFLSGYVGVPQGVKGYAAAKSVFAALDAEAGSIGDLE
jgi:alkylhydroperoxidase/carboxymuconolactone decarboxylase family protein YurZ